MVLRPSPQYAQCSQAGVLPGSHKQAGLLVLTVRLHQINLHVVGNQGVRQLREKALHGTSHGVHCKVFLCQVQVVV